MNKLDILISKVKECKDLASELELDPDQVSGLLGEAVALKIIREVIRDRMYIPAPPREDNIDGIGMFGRYSVKFVTPKMHVLKSSERNLIKLHSDLNFDFLLVVCNTGEVFNIPREVIVNNSEFKLIERRKRKLINWMTMGSRNKYAIRPTNDNWQTMMDNYLVCTLK
jgi:hypothetical protein